MIESIDLRNFQLHKSRLVEFDRRVTTIIGATEAGKSTVFRGLRWASLNQFLGPADGFIRWGAKYARVRLVVDGHTIQRKKGSTNSYKLDDQEFRAFGANKVPDPIASLLQITEANFQGQLDLHFWFSETAGEISRALNQIVNLGSIDNAMASIATTCRKARSEVEVCERRLRQSITERDELKWIDDVEGLLAWLEKRSTSIEKRRLAIASLRSRVESMSKARDVLRKRSSEAERASSVAAFGTLAVTLHKRANKLRLLIERLVSANKLAKRVIKEPPSPKIVKEIADRRDCLSNIIYRIQEQEEKICRKQKTVKALTTEMETRFKGLCPVCGKSIKAS